MKLAVLLFTLVAGAAQAQTTVWRCGASYADAPCPGGREVLVADGRSTGERAAAEDVLARDRALADRLRAERIALLHEQMPPGNGLAGIRGGGELKPTKKPASPKRPKAPVPPKPRRS